MSSIVSYFSFWEFSLKGYAFMEEHNTVSHGKSSSLWNDIWLFRMDFDLIRYTTFMLPLLIYLKEKYNFILLQII